MQPHLTPVRLAFAAVALALIGCGERPAPEAPPSAETPADALQVSGRVVRIEDGAYPMFFVHVLPAGQVSEMAFDLNAEDAELGAMLPADFAGKDATVSYVVENKPSLVDVHVDGKTVLGDAAPSSPLGDLLTVTGVLAGAGVVSGGDLPDEVTVTPAAGTAMAFDYFIPPTLVAANGRQVTAYYAADTQNRITAMRPQR